MNKLKNATDEFYIKYNHLLSEYLKYLHFGIPVAPIIVRKPVDINYVNEEQKDKTLDDYLVSSKESMAEMVLALENAVNEAKKICQLCVDWQWD